MIAEAVDTLIVLGWALLAWIAVAAGVVTLALWTVAATAWSVVSGACRAVAGALAAERALRALGEQPDRYRPPQRPSWAAA